MGIIKKLDQKTINLIAAGEVVERPASVVKELVENSIDAHSSIIKIKLIDSGLVEINILDNGCGMDMNDAKMAIEPHATSKINNGNDLFKISTLGFRGEALPSIVAVSQFRLKTSEESGKGIMYSLRGGTFLSEAIVSCNRGTEITVKNLFFNTPARLQNMATPAVELSYITELINKIAIANPNISFILFNNDKELIHTYGNNNLLETICNIYGIEVGKNMLEFYGKNQYFEISGYTSNLSTLRSTRSNIITLVNGRVIRNNNILNAIVKGYQERLMGGKYPICVMNINLDPGLVDVNVHPAKSEVRFSNELDLTNLITKIINDTLEKANLIIDLDNTYESESKKNIELELNNNDYPVDSIKNDEIDDTLTTNDICVELDDFDEDDKKNEFVNLENFDNSDIKLEEKDLYKEENEYIQEEYSLFEEDLNYNLDEKKYKLPKMEFIGQLYGTYILAQGDDNFYIIDQHAAAERVNYERIINELKKENNINYELLIPFNLEFSVSELILIDDHMDDFKKLSIEIEHFGGNVIRVRKVPIWLPKGLEKEYIEEIISQIINNSKKEKYEFLNSLAKSLACKKSIKANEYHNRLEIEYLLEDLAKASNPFTCPHGRPTIVKFSKQEIEKWFKRIVQ